MRQLVSRLVNKCSSEMTGRCRSTVAYIAARERVENGDELDVTMVPKAAHVDLAAGHLQSGEQAGGGVASVIMGAARRKTRPHRQQLLIQRRNTSEWNKRPTIYRSKVECEHVLDRERRLANRRNRHVAASGECAMYLER